MIVEIVSSRMGCESVWGLIPHAKLIDREARFLGEWQAFAILLGSSQQLYLRRHRFLLYEIDLNLFIFAKPPFVNIAIHGECFRIINKIL